MIGFFYFRVSLSLEAVTVFFISPMGISHVFSRFFHHFMLHKRASEAFVAKENSDISDLASSPIKKRRIGISDSASDNKSSIVASGSGETSVVHQLDMAFGNSNRQEIDEDLHSRQLAVYGRETMRRLFASNVLISGMHGLGAEIGMCFFDFVMR